MAEIGRAIRALDCALNNFDSTLLKIEQDENPIIETMSLDVKQDVETLSDALDDFLAERDTNILDDLLEERRLFNRCDKLLQKSSTLFPRYFFYMTRKISEAKGQWQSALQSFGNELTNVIKEITDSFLNIYKVLAENSTPDAAVMVLLKDSFRGYAHQLYNQTERDLRHEAQKFKERRNAPLSPEVWGHVLANENRAIELARDGKLTSKVNIDDEHYEGYSDDSKKQMEESFSLMQKILTISMDDSLFDFEYGLKPHVNLLSDLNVHNLDVFHEIILRHNIIRCGAFPSLKDKYDQWMNTTSSLSQELENQREPAVLFTPKAMECWKRLHEKGYVDENYQPKLSKKKRAIIALAMGETLNLNPLWEPFEILWGLTNGSSVCSQARNNTQYGPELYDKIKSLLK